MKENAVFGALRTTHHTGNAVVKAPARDPSDFCMAHSAESVLFMPEKAKRANPLIVFGRVPFFYYGAHLLLAHLIAIGMKLRALRCKVVPADCAALDGKLERKSSYNKDIQETLRSPKEREVMSSKGN